MRFDPEIKFGFQPKPNRSDDLKVLAQAQVLVDTSGPLEYGYEIALPTMRIIRAEGFSDAFEAKQAMVDRLTEVIHTR